MHIIIMAQFTIRNSTMDDLRMQSRTIQCPSIEWPRHDQAKSGAILQEIYSKPSATILLYHKFKSRFYFGKKLIELNGIVLKY